jgi:ferredoxin
MLEFAAAETNETSRLSCQITMTAKLDGLKVRTPPTQG